MAIKKPGLFGAENNTNIEWRQIPNHGPYEVSNIGQIRHIRKKKLLTPAIYEEGYLYYGVYVNGKSRGIFAHRAVALAFIGPQPSLRHEVAHWDNNEQNNTPSNLRWATPTENRADMARHGTLPIGLKNGNAKLSDEQVREIRRLRKAGMTIAELGIKFKVNPVTCLRISTKETRGRVK